jgi:catechol 2,3-dioxygenase-like lactoylglutathione lyase family enzyme
MNEPPPRLRLAATVLSTPDANALAGFYRELLGWNEVRAEPGWVVLRPADGAAGLSFQTVTAYRAPVWPERADEQQMMLHLDIQVSDLAGAERRAVELGACLADHQPQAGVRVLLDPDGHPFCLFES